ncbi:transposase [Alkalihalobacillus deserti]|uniref:transposase n=1 Tax=Alkalihalobacillus deserti TaxID=2879466 RepID=UPI00355804D5
MSPFKAFKQEAKTIKKWEDEILHYFITGYTNARTEGTNHKIKNIKRRCYGISIAKIIDVKYKSGLYRMS